MNYAFGREFEELTQGSRLRPRTTDRLLSHDAISNPRMIRFSKTVEFLAAPLVSCLALSLFRKTRRTNRASHRRLMSQEARS